MTAPPVVLVPGMLCDADLWADVGVPSPVVHAEVTAPDIGGMAEQVLAAVDGPFVLAGLSLGAIAGFEVARRAPGRLAGFCAMATNAGAPRREQLAGWADLDRLTADGGFEAAVARILPAMFADPDPVLHQRFLGMAGRVGPAVFRAQLAAQATRRDAHAAIAGLSCPVLVLCGERDALCPPAFHHKIAAHARDATCHVIPGAGHLLTLEAPDTTTELLRDWLRGLSKELRCPRS